MNLRRSLVALLTVALPFGASVGPSANAAAAPAAAPAIGAIEDALPPGARQVLAGIRIFKGLSGRNRVYRDARSVQGDLRAYYDAQIETARRQLLNREQLGLESSQVRAYQRVMARLQAERDAALDITEDEKRAAKFGFESKLKQELTGALLRVPRMRRGLERAKEAIEDVRDAFEQARTAIEGGNPINNLVADLRGKLDRLDRYAALGGLLNGPLGRTLGNISNVARAELDKVEAATSEAVGAARTVIGELDSLTGGIGEGLEATRTVRADAALEQAADAMLDRIFAPRGGGSPDRDVIADALARDALTPLQANVGVALGAIDPTDFRRMRDRVHAAMLGRSLERIGKICGRLAGAARRIQLDATAAGDPTPNTSTPCTLFGDPEKLQAFVDSQQDPDDDSEEVDSELVPVSAGEGDSSGRDVNGEYVGPLDLGAFEFEGTETVMENEVRLAIADGTVQGLAGNMVVVGPCEGGSVTLGMGLDATFVVPVSEELGWSASGTGLLTLSASGHCDEEDGGFITIEDFNGLTAPFDAVVDLSTDLVSYTLTFEEGDTMTGTLERVASDE